MNQVQFTWATATETNNNYFTLERSLNGVMFEKLFTVQSSAPGGNSSTQINYSAVDVNAVQGTSYYRLKQTDFSGAFSYSPIQEAILEAGLVVYPNPLEEGSTLTYVYPGSFDGTANVKIYNSMGQRVYEATIAERKNSLEVHLTPGIFLIEAVGVKESFRKTIMVR